VWAHIHIPDTKALQPDLVHLAGSVHILLEVRLEEISYVDVVDFAARNLIRTRELTLIIDVGWDGELLEVVGGSVRPRPPLLQVAELWLFFAFSIRGLFSGHLPLFENFI
jgi:hypothetical protein